MSLGWSDKTVTVTGATGFIGSHLVEELLDRGASVRILVRSRTPQPNGALGNLSLDVLQKVELQFGSVLDPEALRRSMQGADCLFHLAALVSIPYSYAHPREVLEVNAVGTVNALLAAREAGAKRVIVMSSSEVYGTARHIPIDEDHPLQAQSPYAASKIAAEKFGESFSLSYGLPVTIVRPFNTFGPRQSSRAVIPTIIAQALFAESIKLGTTNTTRDFTYVEDMVKGLVAVAENGQVDHDVINLGSGSAMSVAQVVERVKELTGSTVSIEQEPERTRPPASEVLRLCANTARAQRVLGWAPKMSFDDGLRATISWIKQVTSPDDASRYHI
jgi:nucleoside-diphosphate-sugar epimerase